MASFSKTKQQPDIFNDENHHNREESIASVSSESEATGTPTSGEEKRISNERQRKSKGRNSIKSIAIGETKAIRALRIIVLLVLVVAATLVSVGVYIFLKREEEDNFESQFYDLAYRLGRCKHEKVAIAVNSSVIFSV